MADMKMWELFIATLSFNIYIVTIARVHFKKSPFPRYALTSCRGVMTEVRKKTPFGLEIFA